MPEPLTTYVTRVDDEMKMIGLRWDDIVASLSTLHDTLTSEGCPNSGDVCLTIRTTLIGIMREYDSAFGWYRGRLGAALSWIDTNWPSNGEEYELTMDKILDVIWKSDKLRWYHFINYIDAMRGGIWNTEIYETHLAEWYRHFSI